ncbi:MAG: 50S ribosomal protein L24 [bacterium]|nr:50S ribosomal protein L24 [bacterium]
MKIHTGDKVKVISGKEKGKDTVVKLALPKENKVVAEGVNVAKKHVKPSARNKQGGIVEITRPLPVSRVMLLCPKCNQPTRVGLRLEGGKRYRVCKKCQAAF